MRDLERQVSRGEITFSRMVELLNEKANEPNGALQCIGGSALLECWLDWDTLTLDQMAEYLRKKYMFSSSNDAKCIYHLIEFYNKHK